MLEQSSRHTSCAVSATKRRPFSMGHWDRPGSSPGFTLIEMMVAMVLTLIMVWAIAEFYARVGEAVKDGRSMIEMRGSLRTATQRLKDDLVLLTLVPAPPATDSTGPGFAVDGKGYFTVNERLCSDADPEGNGIDILPAGGNGIPDIADDFNPFNGIPDFIELNGVPSLLGDVDDSLGFTIRSAGEPFAAQVVTFDPSTGFMTGTSVGASNVAEVAWWTSFREDPLLTTSVGTWEPAETRSLHRRLLLVRPDVNAIHGGDTDYSGPYYFRVDPSVTAADYYSIMQSCDVSIRPIGVYGGYNYYFANSLSDLTRRENRFLHIGTVFPNPIDLNPNYGGDSTQARSLAVNNGSLWRWNLGGPRRGEDVILSNVLAFDVRLFDATAELRSDSVAAGTPVSTLQPGDPGYGTAVANGHPIACYGAYVDLWYNRYTPGTSFFSGQPASVGTVPQQNAYALIMGATYDTWATSYERDGINQDGDDDPNTAAANDWFDEGTDGLDVNSWSGTTPVGMNGVDDRGERETSPPYPVRLRGLEVKVRTYEPGTRQVQQGTVASDFIPE